LNATTCSFFISRLFDIFTNGFNKWKYFYATIYNIFIQYAINSLICITQ